MQPIVVSTQVKSTPEKAWEAFTDAAHIVKWYHASEDWHAPYAENDLKVGGSFKTTMSARDGSASFDFGGVYQDVIPGEYIAFTLGDGRKVEITFKEVEPGVVEVTEKFDPEQENSLELQKNGWQAILDSFKRYVEETSW